MNIGELVSMQSLLERLPKVVGKYRECADLSKSCWFGVGGFAEVLFRPKDIDDLRFFLQHKPSDVPVTILGAGSNILVRDGGIKGVVIRLGGGFSTIDVKDNKVLVTCGILNANLTSFCIENAIGGLEFLSGIPGSVGGALAMNAGAYGTEVKDVLISCDAVDDRGELHHIPCSDMGFSYRHANIPKNWICISAIFQGKKSSTKSVREAVATIHQKREQSQPIRMRTGGSTFANPYLEESGGKKAWQLIDEVGGRGLQVGGAKVSEKHCNFLINTGTATAEDIEMLGEELRRRVYEAFGVTLHWEIRIIGESI